MMVVPPSWSEAYKKQALMANLLKEEVDSRLSKVPSGWFCDSRIKEQESFFQKLETGRYQDIYSLEDFFGAMIVVPLPSDIENAVEFVDKFFETEYKRPVDTNASTLRAEEFRFNELRLYGKLKADESSPPRTQDEVIFEIQIRTFFQHAWSSATHDLVYKYPRFSWARSRVASQVKAMLENAELSIAAIDALESNSLLPRNGRDDLELNEYLDIVNKHWEQNVLPINLKRLTETIRSLSRALGLSPIDVEGLLARGANEFSGHPEGWSPYQCVIDYASRYEAQKLKRLLKKPWRDGSRGPKVIHVTSDVLSRLGVDLKECPRALL